MSSERVRERLKDIIQNVDRIFDYLDGVSLDEYRRRTMVADATERCLERIAEATVQIGEEDGRAVGLDVPWTEIRALGNRLRHEYRRIDSRIIYDRA